MPYIHAKTNVKITKPIADALKAACGEAITLIPGKTETWLMVEVEGEKAMYFAGSDAPCAYVEVKLLGKATNAVYDKLTEKLCEVMAKTLSVPCDRVYVKYEEVEHWGWNGANF